MTHTHDPVNTCVTRGYREFKPWLRKPPLANPIFGVNPHGYSVVTKKTLANRVWGAHTRPGKHVFTRVYREFSRAPKTRLRKPPCKSHFAHKHPWQQRSSTKPLQNHVLGAHTRPSKHVFYKGLLSNYKTQKKLPWNKKNAQGDYKMIRKKKGPPTQPHPTQPNSQPSGAGQGGGQWNRVGG